MTKYSSKRILVITGLIFATIIIGMAFIRARSVETDVTAHATKVGLLLRGAKDDANYSQTHYDSLMDIKDELNLQIVCRENVPENAACLEAIEGLVREGCTIVIGASFGYGEYLVAMAKRHPDIYFFHPFGNEKSTNLASFTGRMYQARYLSGIVAGMRSKSGKVGYVAAFPISEVIRQINAFALGVRSVAPKTRVYVKYCHSWVDDGAAEAASVKLLDRHDIDVLAMHTNSLRPNRVAARAGIWSVGFNKDNAASFPNSYLTACVWQWGACYHQRILSCLQGKFHGDVDWIDMESGIVGLSPLTPNVALGTEAAVAAATSRFVSRRFDVFYGPVRDNRGVLRVPAGESMSDATLLDHFDWYVEGVSVEE